MTPVGGWESGITTADLRKFKEAVIRLKLSNGLYVQSEYGVVFVGGASLFRTTIDFGERSLVVKKTQLKRGGSDGQVSEECQMDVTHRAVP